MSGMITIGVANEGQLNVSANDLKDWVPKNISYFSDTVYFKHQDTFYSMKRVDFSNIFKK